MSEISRELQEQQSKDVGAAIRKVLGDDVATLSQTDKERLETEERNRINQQRAIERLEGELRGKR